MWCRWRGALVSALVLAVHLSATVAADSEEQEATTVRKFTRQPVPLRNVGRDVPTLPASYSKLGPNVLASGSYKRPSRRIGLAFQPEENQLPARFSTNFRVSRQESSDNEERLGVTSQPDIGPMFSQAAKDKLTERVASFQKKFPKFRNQFGSRLQNQKMEDRSEDTDNNDDSDQPSASENNQYQNRRTDSTLSGTSTATPQSAPERKRPFVVRRPLRNMHRNRVQANDDQEQEKREKTEDDNSESQPPMNVRFKQILKRRQFKNQRRNGDVSRPTTDQFVTPPPAQRAEKPFVNLNEPVSDPTVNSNSHWSAPSTRGEHRTNVEHSRTKPNSGRKELSTTSFSTSSFSHNKMSFPEQSLDTASNNESSDSPVDTSVASEVESQSRPPFAFRNRNKHRNAIRKQPTPADDREEERHETHNYSPIDPFRTDGGKDWYPNNPNNPDDKPSDIGYGQYERHGKDPASEEEQSNDQLGRDGFYRDDVRTFTADPRDPKHRNRQEPPPQNQWHRSPSENVNQNYRETVDSFSENFEIPDLSLTGDNSRMGDEMRDNKYSKPQEFYRNSNVATNQITTGYQQFRHPSLNKPKKPEWAFDPQWAVSSGPLTTSQDSDYHPVHVTTERVLMEPTRVPGSAHLVTRNEFPYNFWRPANRNRANEGIYPRSRQEEEEEREQDHSPVVEFREVPDYMFTVGAGPVSIPEDLVRNTYDMVTAAPSFDLMNNPFESDASNFNSLPDVEPAHNTPVRDNRRRAPGRPNRNRRPSNRPPHGRGNPFQGFMNMIHPRPNMRNPNSQQRFHPGKLETEEEAFPHLKNNHPAPRPPVRPHSPHGSLQHTTTTQLPAHPNSAVTGAVGFTHFAHQGAPLDNNHVPSNEDTGKKNNRKPFNGERNNAFRVVHQQQEDVRQQNRVDNELRNVHPSHQNNNQLRVQPPPTSFIPDRSHANHPMNHKVPRRFNNRRRPQFPRGPNQQHPGRHPPAHRGSPSTGHKFLIQQPNWIRDIAQDLSLFDNPVIQPVNPHSKYVTTLQPDHSTRSHFDVKHYDLKQSQGSHNFEAIEVGSRGGFVEQGNQNQELSYGADPHEEQVYQPFVPPNHYVPQDLGHFRRPSPHKINQQARPFNGPSFQNRPVNHQLQRRPQEEIRPEESQSIWSALTNFDFSFLNPFNGSDDPEEYNEEIDRVATVAALPSTLLVPGGLAVLGAGLGIFYFNFVWSPTPVVKARLMDMIMKGTHSNFLTDEQQRAIGDVTKVYSALTDIGAKFNSLDKSLGSVKSQHKKNSSVSATTPDDESESLLPTEQEMLMSQDCKNRLVCQTYHEFDDLLQVTKGAATLLKSTLQHLDQSLLLEFFLAADRGHHLQPSTSTSCAAFYPECQLPQISIRNSLRDLVGIQYDGNELGEGQDMESARSLGEPEKEVTEDGTPAATPESSRQTEEPKPVESSANQSGVEDADKTA